MKTNSTLTHLECTNCGAEYDPNQPHNVCTKCGKVLYARYDLERARQLVKKEDLKGRRTDMWRIDELMPVQDWDNVVALGEGWTPLLPAPRLGAEIGCQNLFVKDEGLNPTASFKARGLGCAVSRAKELGVRAIGIPSAGNAGGAVAAYCARAGLDAYVFMPYDSPVAAIKEAAMYGAHVYLIKGLINDCGKLVRELGPSRGWFDVSTLREPYRQEGKKTMGFELAEQFDWDLPDAVLYPTGGGTGIVGMWKAWQELEAMGWIGPKRPKLISVQSEGCAPIVRAFEQGVEHAELWQNAHTLASGMRVPVAIGDYLMLRAIRESGGTAVTVSDADILQGMGQLGRTEGIFPAPEGAAVLVALQKLLGQGFLTGSERIVLFNTGSGLKYLETVEPEVPIFEKDDPRLAEVVP